MFSPIGPQPPSVYWRRRLLFVGGLVLLLVLVVLTFNAMRSDGAGKPASKSSNPAPVTHSSPTSSSSPTTAKPRRSSSLPAEFPKTSPRTSKSGARAPTTSGSRSTPTVAACDVTNLQIKAVVGRSSYQVGQDPLLRMQVTDVGKTPCVQNLADKDVEMRVYNGESRVWGSRDCKTMPGDQLRTLTPDAPVLVSITWSGFSSQPNCGGTRQRVNAGSYTLYTALAGRTGAAAQFSIN